MPFNLKFLVYFFFTIGMVKHFISSTYFLLLALLLLSHARLKGNEKNKNVLYLNSYHVGYEWADEITEGVTKRLRDIENCTYFTEFMDSKRVSDSAYFHLLYDFYVKKYKDIAFDLVICSDNNALDFVLRYYNTPLLNNLPVTFCGILNTDDYHLPPHFFGVKELDIFELQLNMILNVFPEKEVIYALLDKTVTGNIYRKEYTLINDLLMGSYRVEFLDAYDPERVKEMLDTLNKNGVIDFLSVNIDKDGNLIDPSLVIKEVLKYAKIPVLGNPFGLNKKGMMGGAVVDGKNDGFKCACLAAEILEGRMDSITVHILEPTPNYAFDYDVLQKFNINSSKLPENSLILNKPIKPKKISFALIFGCLLIVVVVLIAVFVSMKLFRWKDNTKKTITNLLREISSKNAEIKQLSEQNDKLTFLNMELNTKINLMIEAEYELNELNKAKSSILFNLSNKLNSLINSITEPTPSLNKQINKNKDFIERAQFVELNISQIKDYIANFQEYARIESGQITLHYDTFSFIPVVTNLLKKLNLELNARNNTIVLINNLAPGDDHIFMDSWLLSRTLKLLVWTSNKLSEHTSFELIFSRIANRQLEITLLNHNVNVEETNFEKFYKTFHQFEAEISSPLVEPCLILTLIEVYVKLMKGELRIDTFNVKGIRFSLLIPYCLV